jgi:hypothetical protein
MAPLGRGLIVPSELVVEIDPHCTRDVTVLECRTAIAAIEVPANVGQHGFGVSADEVDIDEWRDH